MGGRLRPIPREALVELFSSELPPPVEAVWTPETRGPVPPERVPLVLEAYVRGQGKVAFAEVRRGAFFALLLGVLALGVGERGEFPWLACALAATALAVIAVPALARVVRARRAPERAFLRDVEDRARGARLFAAAALRPAPRWSYGIAGLLAAVYVAQFVGRANHPIAAAGLVKERVLDGEAWRCLTGALLHGPPLHLMFNLMALVNLGSDVELFAGRARVATLFLVAALAGSVASVFLGPPGTSVGASGGICGLLGYFVVLGWRRRSALPRGFLRAIATNVVFLAAIGTVGAQMIDNAGHAGGFVAGALYALATVPRGDTLPLDVGRGARVVGALSAAVLLLGALLAAAVILYPGQLLPA